MKLKNSEIFNAKVPMQKILAVKLPVLTGYELLKIERQLATQWSIIDQVRDKLITKYGEEIKDGPPGRFSIDPSKKGFPKFSEELGKLFEEEFEISYKVITLPRDIVIEPFVLMALERFVQIEGTKAKKKRK